jgi:hypothetical protein
MFGGGRIQTAIVPRYESGHVVEGLELNDAGPRSDHLMMMMMLLLLLIECVYDLILHAVDDAVWRGRARHGREIRLVDSGRLRCLAKRVPTEIYRKQYLRFNFYFYLKKRDFGDYKLGLPLSTIVLA